MMSRDDTDKNADVYKAAQAVIDGEDTWEEFPNEYISFGSNGEEILCWFEDMDMDGKPEFMVGPMVSGAHAAHDFEMWTLENGSIEPFELDFGDGENKSNIITMWYHFESSDVSDPLHAQLFRKKSTGEYIYTVKGADGNGSGGISYLSVLNGQSRLWENQRFFVSEYYADQLQIEYTANNQPVDSMQQLQQQYEAFCDDLESLDFTTETFSYDFYCSLAESEKRELLIKSYEAFSFVESDEKPDPFPNEFR